MRSLYLGPKDIYRGSLILIGRSHPLKQPPDSVELVPARPDAPHVLLEKQAATMLSEITATLGCTLQIIPTSGFRTTDEQRALYVDSLREYGADFTKQYVALPGHSEHESGLAIDLAENRPDIDPIRPSFPYEGICQTFRLKAVDYGFIERYPKGREQITNIAHEPWHFRYVGCPHAFLIRELDLTLEEYTEYLRRYPYDGKHVSAAYHRRAFELFFVPIRDWEVAVEIPDDLPYQVSGNNVDGCVVTLWKTC